MAEIAHPGHSPRPYVAGIRSSHNRACTGPLRDFCLFRRRHVHYDAALEHLREFLIHSYLLFILFTSLTFLSFGFIIKLSGMI
jgi:hypothetical protein